MLGSSMAKIWHLMLYREHTNDVIPPFPPAHQYDRLGIGKVAQRVVKGA
jgi:hypothetical protein